MRWDGFCEEGLLVWRRVRRSCECVVGDVSAGTRGRSIVLGGAHARAVGRKTLTFDSHERGVLAEVLAGRHRVLEVDGGLRPSLSLGSRLCHHSFGGGHIRRDSSVTVAVNLGMFASKGVCVGSGGRGRKGGEEDNAKKGRHCACLLAGKNVFVGRAGSARRAE